MQLKIYNLQYFEIFLEGESQMLDIGGCHIDKLVICLN